MQATSFIFTTPGVEAEFKEGTGGVLVRDEAKCERGAVQWLAELKAVHDHDEVLATAYGRPEWHRVEGQVRLAELHAGGEYHPWSIVATPRDVQFYVALAVLGLLPDWAPPE